CDEQVIIVPSCPSHSIQEDEPKDTSGDEVDDSPLDSAKEIFQQELTRLKGQEQRATSATKDAEELQKRASTKIVPPGCIPVPTGSLTDSLFDDEPTTRFPSPSDLGNNEPSPSIFSSSSYDDEFAATLNNLASTVELCKREARSIRLLLVLWCDEFEALMKGEFKMSVMGELTFFLGLQVQQRPGGIFISQNKYVKEILQKFDLENVKTATTPYEAQKPKSKNEPDSCGIL
ncbi:putative ribonuclease H-like domain-containing protein, partial [Tanacetum coccineum]